MYVEKDKYYRTASGERIGPSKLTPWPSGKLVWSMGTAWLYDDQGRCGSPSERDLDLIAEWTEGPVRTVTRREVVYGVYDRVSVWPHADGGFGIDFHVTTPTASELKAAAAVLLELAEALNVR